MKKKMANDRYFEGDKMCRQAFEDNGGLAAGCKTTFFIIIILQSPSKIRNSRSTLVQRMENEFEV